MLYMIFQRRGEDKNVIKVYQYKIVQFILKQHVHHLLKSRRCIRNSKGHYHKLELTSLRLECCLRNIIFFHGYLMIARGQVQSREMPGLSQTVQQIINTGKGISVTDCLSIESTVVHAHSPSSILFRNEQDRRTIRASGRSNMSLCQQIINLR